MKLTVSTTQRIQLCRDMRTQTGDAGALRAWWKLEDIFALDDKEKAAIKFQTRLVDMQEVYLWDSSVSLPDKVVELELIDVARTKHALTTSVHRAQDRAWLEPLLAELEESASAGLSLVKR